MRTSTRLLVLTILLGGSHAALAEGNAADGAGKATVCGGCHGPKGISVNPLWPNLAGQHAEYLAAQIKAYRDGLRSAPTMQPFVMSLSDQDADDLAAHFAALKACP